MAILKYGAIVTEIKGSLGGNTFKSVGSTLVMQRKSNGYSQSRQLQNKQLASIATIFKSWAFLTQEQRDAWVAIAPSYSFPDKFGNMRPLSGRNLYSKLNIQLLPSNGSVVDASTISNEIKPFYIQNFVLGLNNEYHVYTGVTYANTRVQFSFEISNTLLHSPTFVSREVIYQENFQGSSNLLLNDILLAKFPYLVPSYNLRVYARAINEFGFLSPWSFLDLVKS